MWFLLTDRGSGHGFLSRGFQCNVFPWACACSHLPRRLWSRGIWTRVGVEELKKEVRDVDIVFFF